MKTDDALIVTVMISAGRTETIDTPGLDGNIRLR